MKRGRKWLRWVMPLMAVTFLSFAQTTFAQDDYQYDDNSGNYDNSDEALIQPENDVNYNTFHDELTPYGTWRDYPGYGNVWVCNVAGFSPYNTGGHWAYTRFGWTWVSDYNWGWAPFHYGRWGYDNAFGYFWVPGYTWGPAWVSWRNGGDYYGWAPLSPGLSVGINVGVGISAASWTFLPHRYMGYRNSYNYYAPRQRNVTIIRNTTIINNTHVYNNNRFVVGPDRRQVERYSGQRVQQQNIYVTNNRNDNRQVNNGIRLYHPTVNRGGVNNGNGVRNGQPVNRASQDNLRQQSVGGRPMRDGLQRQQNGNGVNGTEDNRPENRLQQRREERMERREEQNGNGVLNDAQRRQDIQNNRDRVQQKNTDQRREQMERMRQQRDQQVDVQRDQQQNAQRQQQMQERQQMNDRRQQMQQQMEQRRQERDAQQQQIQQQNRQNDMQQRQQMMQQRQEQMQQRRQQMDQQRNQMQQQRQQQMQQQRQQQIQQRSQNVNRPATQQGGGGRRGRN